MSSSIFCSLHIIVIRGTFFFVVDDDTRLVAAVVLKVLTILLEDWTDIIVVLELKHSADTIKLVVEVGALFLLLLGPGTGLNYAHKTLLEVVEVEVVWIESAHRLDGLKHFNFGQNVFLNC